MTRWHVNLNVEVTAPSGRAAIDAARAVVQSDAYDAAYDASAYAIHPAVHGMVKGRSVLLAEDPADEDDD